MYMYMETKKPHASQYYPFNHISHMSRASAV